MEEPLSVDDIIKRERRIDWRRFLKGAGIGMAVLGVLVVAMRVFLRSQLDPSLSVDTIPEDFFQCYPPSLLPLPDSLFVLALWWIHAGLAAPFPFPFVPYQVTILAFAISGGGIAASSKITRWVWIIGSGILLIGYVAFMVFFLIAGAIAMCH